MTDRHALLIGVPNCDNDLFEPLPAVVLADITRMTSVLDQSGYAIRHCGLGGERSLEPTGNRIRAAIMHVLRETPAGGILLVYFSGHGVTIDGESYLVPQDAYAGRHGPALESLVPLVPRHLDECHAKLVLFIVDACRNEPEGCLVDSPGVSLPYPNNGKFVLLSSCQPGERSLYSEDGSYFTQALAEALDRRHPARSLEEVYAASLRSMARRTATTDAPSQTPDMVFAQQGDVERAFSQIVICDGDQVGEAWRRAVDETNLWERLKTDDHNRETIHNVAYGIVDECAQNWLDAREYLTSRTGMADPWTAQDYPVRVLAAIQALLPPDADLTVAEFAILITAPFIREAALSAGIRLAATVAPGDFRRTYVDGPRSDLEITHAIYPHVCRRAEGLDRRKRTASRDALAMWLIHQWLAGRSSTWTESTVVSLYSRLARACAGSGNVLTERELNSILPVLVTCIDGDPGNESLVESLNHRVFDKRMRSLGTVLWLSGTMAADPRRAPTVVVDHIGIGAELQLASLHAATVNAAWQRNGDTLALKAVCNHPALFASFADIVSRAKRIRRTIAQFDIATELTSYLPKEFSDDGLRPENHDGSPIFDTPLLRFRLSDEKVRELLMGRQLYGQPDLAIRELYQNALDACRYRHVRRQYRERQRCAIMPWAGRISFQQGTDPDGREFIECTDNGVGMTHETLMRTFANAGESFVYRPSFRAEQILWQELNPPLRLIPNSQFGVGVFSYFMIAEEISITTRPVNDDDLVATTAYSVRIASSGSLFQITSSTEMPAGGTRVRLYLTGEDRLSVLRTLRRLVWVSEYVVDVAEHGGSNEQWLPEKLRYPDAAVEPLQYGEDLWWVPGEGCLTADGIRTNETRYGLVVNLRGPHRPQFTVDRNRLRYWDRAWVRQQIIDSLPSLRHWPGLTLSWLWSVAEKTPSIADDIFGSLVETETELAVEGSWGRTVASAKRVGCLTADRELFTQEMIPWYGNDSHLWLTSWRVGVWKGVTTFAGAERIPEASRIDGFPVVRPLDADVLSSLYEESKSYRSPARYGHPAVSELLEIVADEDETPTERLRRLRRYAITGIDLTAARQIPPIDYVFPDINEPLSEGTEEAQLLGAVAAWSPPGSNARPAVGFHLAKTSAQLRIPLGEVLRRAAALVPNDWTLPAFGEFGTLHDHVFTWNEVELFAEELQRYGQPIGPIIWPAHIVRASSKLGRSVGHILGLFDRFKPLGYQVAGRDMYPEDLTPIEHSALYYAQDVGYELTPLHLVMFAGQANTDVKQIRSGLKRIADKGLIRLPADVSDIEMPTGEERTVIAEDLHVYDARAGAYTLATEWLAVRELIREIGGREFHDFDERVKRRRRLLDVVNLHRPVTIPEIIDLAYYFDYTIAAAIDHYRFLYPMADLTTLPDMTPMVADLRPRYEEWMALLGGPVDRHGEHDVSWSLRVGDILTGAARASQSIKAFLDRLEPYRLLGAPLPELTPAERESLPSRAIDRHDRAMLMTIGSYGHVTFVDRISPLMLVQIAGKYGWKLTETDARLAPLRSIGLTLEYSPEGCFDDIVTWQDLLILTENIDGQAPSIAGRIPDQHIASCAAEIDESETQIITRLSRYSRLFGLEVE